MSALGGVTVHALALSLPMFGSWRADVTLVGGDAPAEGSTTQLVVGDLSLKGSVLRSGFDAPGKPHAVVVGGLGWDKAITTPLSYDSEGGVRLSTVLRALSAISGEPIEQPVDRVLDEHYECVAQRGAEQMRARDALAALCRAGVLAPWRVDPDSVTRFGARSGTASMARATVLRNNAALGFTVVGLDAPAGFLPGNTFEGAAIQRLYVNETSGKLEAELWQ